MKSTSQGVSPIIGMILVFGIVVSVMSTILYVGMLTINESKKATQFSNGLNQIEYIDRCIDDLILEGVDSRRTVNIAFSEGYLSVPPYIERWIIYYNLTTTLGVTYTGLDNDDRTFDINSNPSAQTVNVTIYWLIENKEWGRDVTTPATVTVPSDLPTLTDTIRIRVRNTLKTVEYSNLYLCDTYWLMYEIGGHKAIIENSGILVHTGSETVYDDILMFENADLLSLRLLQLRKSNVSGGHGVTTKISISLLYNLFHENSKVYNITMEIFGAHKTTWANYLKLDYKFVYVEEKLYYKSVPIQFHLSRASIEMKSG